MSALKPLLEEARRARGVEHLITVRTLRGYIKASTEDELILEIRKIDDFEHLRILIEVGISASLQAEVYKRYDQLKAR